MNARARESVDPQQDAVADNSGRVLWELEIRTCTAAAEVLRRTVNLMLWEKHTKPVATNFY